MRKEDYPEEPGIYAFTRNTSSGKCQIVYIGSAAQGLRTRIYGHHLINGDRTALPLKKSGPDKGGTRQEGGCNLIYAITREKAGVSEAT